MGQEFHFAARSSVLDGDEVEGERSAMKPKIGGTEHSLFFLWQRDGVRRGARGRGWGLDVHRGGRSTGPVGIAVFDDPVLQMMSTDESFFRFSTPKSPVSGYQQVPRRARMRPPVRKTTTYFRSLCRANTFFSCEK